MLSAVLTAALTLSASPSDPTLCPGQLRDLFDGRSCLISTSGLAVADSAERAADLLEWADSGRRRIAARTMINPAPFAVIDGNGGEKDAAVHLALQQMGYTIILDWLSPAAVQKQMEQSVAQAVRDRMFAAGVSGSKLEQIVANAVAGVAGQTSPTAVAQRDSVVVPHELAHKWLVNAFWLGVSPSGASYGGPGPDWLDEMVAVLAEPDHSLTERREQFWTIYRSDVSAGRKSGFDRLSEFLAADHPMAGKMAASGVGGAGFSVRVVDSSDPSLNGVNPGHYYLNALIFHDFLGEQGLPAVGLHHLIATISAGHSLDDWLANNGPEHGLPDTLPALEVRWVNWLQENAER